MLTFSVRPIRLLLQILTADAFIGERDKTACGRVVKVKQQGTHNRLQIITDSGESCVWRLGVNVIKVICDLFCSITVAGLDDHSDSALDYLAGQIVRSPTRGTLQLWTTYDSTAFIDWHYVPIA